jgi:UDP-3-O-[3-hydroxymyristoyl] glucosamine N-acyltransferase LpxD
MIGVHASVENCRLGAGCVVHSGVRIGADGFGFFVDAETGAVRKKPQLLRVLIGDGVEIGAGSCIDRGSWRDTRLGDHTKVDNLVQIGHNVHIGRSSLICAHSALGGSSELGDYCVMGGRSAVADHVHVCSHVRLAAKAGVTKHITAAGDYAGFPAQPVRLWRREMAAMRAVALERLVLQRASRRARREGGGGGGGRHPRDDDANVAGDLKGACSDEEALARHAIHGAQA